MGPFEDLAWISSQVKLQSMRTPVNWVHDEGGLLEMLFLLCC